MCHKTMILNYSAVLWFFKSASNLYRMTRSIYVVYFTVQKLCSVTSIQGFTLAHRLWAPANQLDYIWVYYLLYQVMEQVDCIKSVHRRKIRFPSKFTLYLYHLFVKVYLFIGFCTHIPLSWNYFMVIMRKVVRF